MKPSVRLDRHRRPARGRGAQAPAAASLALALIAGTTLLSSGAAAHAEPPVRCRDVAFDVALAPEEPADQVLRASLCARGTLQNKTIQVLVHGATMNRSYWDFPFEPENYSYVEHMTRQGYATLSVDRVGYGESSRPDDGADVTLQAGAFTLHQVIEELREGERIVPGFGRVKGERILLVGSSMGSFISKITASTYGGVDGVVLTSFLHNVGAGGIASFDLNIPAQEDPKFADLPYPNYLSQEPGSAEFLFFHLPNSDPDVVSLTEALRDVWTTGEVDQIFETLEMPVDIDVPTLVVVGDYDNITCDLPCTETGGTEGEAELYPPEACVQVEVVPDTGHALNLHENAGEFFDLMAAWSDAWVGADTRRSAPASCPSP